MAARRRRSSTRACPATTSRSPRRSTGRGAQRWQRLLCWVSGHGEGWALYAERLMADLGYLDDPGDRMGMLEGQATRAARVVMDIGVHCVLDVPEDLVRRDGLAPARGRTSPVYGVHAQAHAMRTRHCASRSTATSAGRARRRRTRSVSGSGWPPATTRSRARATPSTSRSSTAGRPRPRRLGLDPLRGVLASPPDRGRWPAMTHAGRDRRRDSGCSSRRRRRAALRHCAVVPGARALTTLVVQAVVV